MSQLTPDFDNVETPEFSEVSNNAILSKNVDIENIKNGLLKLEDTKANFNRNTLQSNPDQYEPNDTMDSAAQIPYNQTIYANIDNENDFDWYKVHLTAGTDVAFLLKNIPSGTDYDLYIFDPNLNYAVSQNAGSQDERLYINIQTSGTWYVVVVPYSGYNPNQNYSLFVGNAWKNNNLQLTPSDMTFHYNSSNVGTILPYKILDLRYENTIPNSARVTGIQISTNTSTGNWGNQVKYIYSPQSSTRYQTFTGLNVVLNLPQDLPPQNVNNLLFLKQQWPITSSIETLFTTTATWSPRINFNYKYLVE